jgi:hypothetical protein
MAESFLSYESSQTFRKNLILLNLQPYNIDGTNPEDQGTVVYQQSLPDLANPEVLFSLDTPGFPAIIRNDNPDEKIIPSTYTAYNILTSTSPQGSQGSISQDSYLAKIGAQSLKSLLLDTNAKYIEQQIQAQNSVTFNITTPDVNDTFESKLEGSYVPASPIPGDYFLDGVTRRNTDTLGEAINLAAGRSTLLGGIFNGGLTRAITPSQLFLQNTGQGQKGILFSNLSYNIYRPPYGDSTASGIVGNLLTSGINNILDNFGLQLPGAYYVGSVFSEPAFATSPLGATPIDVYGRDTQAKVLGPDVLAKDYEGNEGALNFGLQGKSIIDQGNIESNFIWVSPKYKAGNDQFYSTNINFKPGSILDDTQRLIESADRLQGDARLKHVGNAMNQISKVFDDGYKKITKGSKVATYKDSLFEKVVGEEYCRVFTKVDSYSRYERLQKPEGITNYGRRFDNSVLDNTYNLNIAPLKGENSTNIIQGQGVKKYMFSIENLAWASNNDLFQDLPDCEKGPNGGRIMWFPPYSLTFNDNSTANWNETPFLGRPEPVYTYKNTSRNGSITWKIVVDHPSVLNVIVNKVLSKETPFDANRALQAFFAGCQKYDLYDLASKYSTVNKSSLQEIQTILKREPALYDDIERTITKNVVTQESVDQIQPAQAQTADLSGFIGLGFYFDNNIPPPNSGVEASGAYDSYYDAYYSQKTTYKQKALNKPDEVESFFDTVLKYNFDTIQNSFFDSVYEALNNGSEVVISMEGSASASASDSYNLNLSKRRINSVQRFLENYQKGAGDDIKTLKKFFENKKLVLNPNPQGEAATNVSPVIDGGSFGETASCTEPPKYLTGPKTGQNMTNNEAIYTTQSMSCRSVRIKNITVTPPKPPDPLPPETRDKVSEVSEVVKEKVLKQDARVTQTTKVIDKPGLSKRVLRLLLNECDYFEVLKETDPFVYDELRKKLKFFSPTFHSTTPEGLNSRLTFLNQCLRPGNTIPVIGSDGQEKTDDSLNTAFGAPPVCVLRIGDFYNTKIIPKNLQITYDNNGIVYDMNPEGIGLQPMIAQVTLSFDFIGGQGLANPVEELQNALSFNYYANTEIFDERATATEDVSDLDVLIDFSKKLPPEQPAPKPVDNPLANSQGQTIGKKTKQEFSDVSEFGEISYRDLMRSILDQSTNYFSSVINKTTSISNSYNSKIVDLVTSKRSFTNGTVGNLGGTLFGYCFESQTLVNKLIDDVKNDITANNNTIIQYFLSKGFSDQGIVIQAIRTNMLNYVEGLRQDFVNGIILELDGINQEELALISLLDQMNIVYTNIDGKVTEKNDVVIYTLSGSSSADLFSDYDLLGPEYDEFISFLYSNELVSDPLDGTFDIASSTFEVLTLDYDKRFFTLMSQIITDKNKLETFKNALLPTGNVISGIEVTSPKPPLKILNKILGLNNFQEIDFGFGFDNMHERYSQEKRKQDRKYSLLPVKAPLKYNKYTKFFNPYNKLSNKRILDYVYNPSATEEQKTKILNLWSQTYNGDQNSYNGKKSFT